MIFQRTVNDARPSSLSPRSLLRFAIVAILVGIPRLALADLPRPPGWEPTCTLDKEQKKGGGPCEQCRGWQDPDPCQKALENKGYTRRCTEGGAGSFVAVWCKGATGAPNATNATDTPSASAAPAATPATTPTPTTTAAAPTTATPPPVAPSADNRRGSGNCSVHAIGQDKPQTNLWLLLPLGLGLGVVRRRGSSRTARSTARTARKNAFR